MCAQNLCRLVKDALRAWPAPEVKAISGHGLQMNGSDCGVFLCLFARCIVQAGRVDEDVVTPVSQRTVADLRRSMPDEVRSGALRI